MESSSSTHFDRASRGAERSAIKRRISKYLLAAQTTLVRVLRNRLSAAFQSAATMSDSQSITQFYVNGPVASVYEFKLDPSRKEGCYPYLTYDAGEIFDVFGGKGELWLAKNRNDALNTVGWIWMKHFVELVILIPGAKLLSSMDEAF